MTKKQRKPLNAALKILISAVLIYFIVTKIDLNEVIETIKTANPGYLLLATLFFVLSKVCNALRLNLYFHEIGAKLTEWANFKLYLLGMFYNLFLPGGIGGDAYKGYVIQKQFETGTRKVVAALLLDRLSGMVLIFIFICILGAILQLDFLTNFKWLFILAIPIAISVFWMIHKRFFSYLLPVFWKSLGYSVAVQVLQLIVVFFIIKSLSIESNLIAYLVIFLISSIVSVIPLTIGGIGSREVTFLYGAKWLGLDSSTSIAISVVFFFITALTSLLGVIYHFKKPKLEEVDQ